MTKKKSVSLGQRIRQAREAAGISQVEAALRAWGDHRRQADWSAYETDRHQPTILVLRKIAEVLGIKISELID